MSNRKGYAVYDQETDTYSASLPGVTITPRNINLAQVVRNGTSSFTKPIIKTAETALDFTPLSPALTVGRIGAAVGNYSRDGNKNKLGHSLLGAAVEALPYANFKAMKTPIIEADNLIKTFSKEKFGIDKISLATPRKGVIADIELSPAGKEFGKRWMHPEYINVVKGEQGKGLSNVLYDEGIKHAKKNGYDGILSGEVLLQPEKTIKTQKRFEGPEMKHFIEEYNYPIKGMEAPKDPKLASRIVEDYNKNNMYKSTLGKEVWNMTKSLWDSATKPKPVPKIAPAQIQTHADIISYLRQ